MAPARILVVEDDHGLRDVLARGLRREEFDVVTAVDGSSAVRTATNELAAIVLDIGLPDSDGRDVCQALRARGIDAPIIFLTARSQIDDRLSGFAAGGDDYLTKPFALAELVARLRAALRRNPAMNPAVSELTVDPVTYTLRLGGAGASLSPIEFRLLAVLLAEPGTVHRRRRLKDAGWPGGGIVSDNTLDQYIRKLRKRLREVGAGHVVTVVRGVGYRCVEEPGPAPVASGAGPPPDR